MSKVLILHPIIEVDSSPINKMAICREALLPCSQFLSNDYEINLEAEFEKTTACPQLLFAFKFLYLPPLEYMGGVKIYGKIDICVPAIQCSLE